MEVLLFAIGEKLLDFLSSKILEDASKNLKIKGIFKKLKKEVDELSLAYKDNDIALLSSEFNDFQNKYFNINKIFTEKLCYDKHFAIDEEDLLLKEICKRYDYKTKSTVESYFNILFKHMDGAIDEIIKENPPELIALICRLRDDIKSHNNKRSDEIISKLNEIIVLLKNEPHKKNENHISNHLINSRSFDSIKKYAERYKAPLFGEKRFTKAIHLNEIYITPTFSSGMDKENEFIDCYIKFENGAGLIIEGEPGAGKSAFVSFLANEQKSIDGKMLFQYEYIFFVQGKDIRNSKGSPLDDIANVLKIDVNVLMQLNDAVLILDAYDEISYASISRENNTQYFSSLTSCFNNFFIIVTSRTNYIPESHLPKIKLNNMSPDQIDFYLTTYNSLRVEQEKLEESYLSSILSLTKLIDDDLSKVISIPLFLYMTVINKVDTAKIDDVYDLYDKIFYENNETSGSVLSVRSGNKTDIKNESVEVANEATILAESIAHSMYVKNSLYLGENEIHDYIENRRINVQLKEKLKNRFGVEIYLQGVSDNIFTFVHKSIYEYFASKYILSKLTTTLVDYLLERSNAEDVVKIIIETFTSERIEFNIMRYHLCAIRRGAYDAVYQFHQDSNEKIEKLINILLVGCLCNTRTNLEVPFWKRQWIMMNWVFGCICQVNKTTDTKALRILPECMKYMINTHHHHFSECTVMGDYTLDGNFFMLYKLDLSNIEFLLVNFSFMVIMNAIFDMSKITRCIFRTVSIESQVFYKVRFTECLFIDCDFNKETIFQECDLRNTDFTNQNLNNISFIDCDLRDATFIDAIMTDTILERTHVYIEDFDYLDRETSDMPDLTNAIIHEYTDEDGKQTVINFW